MSSPAIVPADLAAADAASLEAAASSDTLPDQLHCLLKAISLEAAKRDDSWIVSPELKTDMQNRIKQHARANSAQTLAAADSSSSTAATGAPGASLAPALFRQLSEAASTGLISHALKTELKGLMLSARIARPTQRLVRQVHADGAETFVTEQLDLSHIDADACRQMQQEEREALLAIYEEDIVFEEANSEKSVDGRAVSGDARAGSCSGASASAAAPSASSTEPEPSLCSHLELRMRPYPGQHERGRGIGCVTRFSFPPLYPYVRPSFTLLRYEGGLTDTEGMLLATAVNEKLQELFQVEPRPVDQATVCVFELVGAGEAFLQEYVAFLEDKDYHTKAAADQAQREEQARQVSAHAQAVLAHLNSKTPGVQWDYSKQITPEQRAAAEQRRREREEAELEERSLADASFQVEYGSLVPKEFFHDVLPRLEEVAGRVRPIRDYIFTAANTQSVFYLEPIFTSFLVYRFLRQRAKMHQAAVSLGFHGSRAEVVPSITENGLVVPGQLIGDTGHKLLERSGLLYGRGIYVSPDPRVATCYATTWASVFVCLVLRGRVWKMDQMQAGCGLQSEYDSHEAKGVGHWILFDAAQVLPIFVIRVCGRSQVPEGRQPFPFWETTKH